MAEFVQTLDDVAFELARKDMLGRKLFAATSTEYKVLKVDALKRITATDIESDEQGNGIGRQKGCRIFLKSVYFINLAALVTGLAIIGDKQHAGDYRCNTVSK